MAALVEGVEYGLSSHGTTSAYKSLLQVKLTDSALKAIEEFTNQKDGLSRGRAPSIQFDGTTGSIQIPTTHSMGNDDQPSCRTFHISLAPIHLDAKGSFDCIQQSGGYRGEHLDLLGSMTHKISIHANDDSYKKTRERMALVEEQQKKQSAKEIKPSGPNIGKRVKIVKKNSPIPPPANRQDRFSPIDPSKNYSSSSLSSKYNSISSSASHGTTTNKVPSHDQRSQYNTHSSNHNSSSHPHRSSPSLGSTNNSSHLTHSSQNKPTANPEVLKRPLKERIIHLLALKPYKKPEIMLKLKNEGIREKDKNQIGTLLRQIGVFNTRDNSYCLGKHLYSEVQLDWVGYREQDRQLLKRKLALDITQSNTPPPTTVSPAVSPVHSIGSNQGSPTNSQKRPAAPSDEHEEAMAPNAKKIRISHMSNNNSNRGKSSSRPPSPSCSKSSSRPNSPSVHQQSFAQQNNNPPPPIPIPTAEPIKGHSSSSSNTSSNSAHHRSRSSSNNRGSGKKEPHRGTDTSVTKNKSVHSSLSNQTEDEENNQENNNISKPDQEKYDFISEYKNIDTLDQRQKYKQLFNSEYEEYRQLHGNIEKVTRIFQELREQLYREEEGSRSYENIKDKIVQEYKELKKDPCYSKNRKRCEYLHKKLAHIKSCILEFDKSNYCNS